MSGPPAQRPPSAAQAVAADWTTATAETVLDRALAILDEERSTWTSRRETPGPDGGADRAV